MTDEDIIAALCAGGAEQSAALRRLYEHKGREFGRFFMAKGLSRADADDVLQEALLKVLKQLCGAGGARDGRTLELQGDHRERVQSKLEALGHRVKLAGG